MSFENNFPSTDGGAGHGLRRQRDLRLNPNSAFKFLNKLLHFLCLSFLQMGFGDDLM